MKNNNQVINDLQSLKDFMVKFLHEDLLKNKFDIDSKVLQATRKQTGSVYNYISVSKAGYLTLCKIIAPYVFESMKYKIANYDSLGGGTKTKDYDKAIRDFSIVPFKDFKILEESKHVFDIEVEGLLNFVACVTDARKFVSSGVVAHNCQNLSLPEIKTVLTRAGEGTKIILTGDMDQVDVPASQSGLKRVIEAFKTSPIAAHISLQKTERSQLAEEAAERL
jgi:hypothetical protein